MKAIRAIEIRDPLLLNERIFSLAGVWPLEYRRMLFMFMVVYFGLHLIMQVWDLNDFLNDIDMTVSNFLETLLLMSAYLGFILVVRRRKELAEVIVEMKRYIADGESFENDEEKLLYFDYNRISYIFSKYSTMFSLGTITLVYLHPLIALLTSSESMGTWGNDTIPYVLPFRAHIFFDYNTSRLYTSLYAYQLPVTYVPMYHVAEVGFIVNTVLHLCAKLSILSYRIRNIGVDSAQSFKDGIRRSVGMHLTLTRLSKTLIDCFDIILLIELMSCSIRLGLALYISLLKISTEPTVAINFIFYAADVTAFLYLYSYIGEQLMYESQMVGEAYYNINWPEVASNDRTDLLMCIMNGQKTMYVTAGKFYIFSRFGFTEIMKTSMACVSLLQASM